MTSWSFKPIGVVSSCFKQKFGIPRQPGLVQHAYAVLKLRDEPFLRQALRGLEGFSHLWLIFVFHRHDAKDWKPSIRPPRLGGQRKMGVLASRSPHRPNPIGLSAVRLLRVNADAPGGAELYLAGVDLLDGTPVLDIKPYLPYADAIADAQSGWAEEPIRRVAVVFEEKAEQMLARLQLRFPTLRDVIIDVLSLDPRPAFQQRRFPPDSPAAQGTRYGFALDQWDIRWEIHNGQFRVHEIVPLVSGSDSEGQ